MAQALLDERWKSRRQKGQHVFSRSDGAERGGRAGVLHRPVYRVLQAHHAQMETVHKRDLYAAIGALRAVFAAVGACC